LPKVELHLHLEGAIPLASLWQLVRKYGGESEVPTLAALASRFQFRDFPHFIDTWVWKNQFLREYEDFTFIASGMARDLASQNVLYAEVFYSPGDYRRVGLDHAKIAGAIRTGFSELPDIRIGLITDLIRDHGPGRAESTLDVIREISGDFGIIGVGIGGSEHLFPPEPFAQVYERARSLGLRTTAHAGEARGPESVWGAVRALRADRIGHATRAIEDPALADYLAEHQIPVELCVISNVRTGAVKSIAEHPARAYFERGIPLSVNTDDPKLFNTSLADEYLALHTDLGFSVPEIHSLIEQGVQSSWLRDEGKNDLLRRIRQQTGDIGTPPASVGTA
jgi:adenosine deaminase